MRTIFFYVALTAATVSTASSALAQAAPAAPAPLVLKAGSVVRTADGKLVGDIEEVQARGGVPVSVSIIVDQRFIRIPASTLSAGAKGVVTSLSRRELAALPN